MFILGFELYPNLQPQISIAAPGTGLLSSSPAAAAGSPALRKPDTRLGNVVEFTDTDTTLKNLKFTVLMKRDA